MKGSLIPLDKLCPSCKAGRRPGAPNERTAEHIEVRCQRCGRWLAPTYWRLRCYTGTRTAGNNPRQAGQQFRGPERSARTALAQFVGTLSDERNWSHEKATVDDLLKRWMEHQSTRCTAYTLDDYRYKLERHILPKLGRTRLSRLSAAELDRTYDAWAATGLSAATVRKMHNMLSAALHQAVKWGWLRQSPTDRASPPRVVREDRDAIPLGELRALVQAAEDAECLDGVLPTAIALGAITGCRMGELCALRWSDKDTQAKRLTVRRSLTVVKAEAGEGPTKSKRAKVLALDAVALEILERRREHQEQIAGLASVKLARDPFVLSRDPGGSTPCLPDGLTHAFGRLVEQLWPRERDGKNKPVGEPRWHFHDLRHFAATTLVQAGVDIKTAQARMGHRTTAMLLDVYSHAVTDSDQQAAEVMGSAFRRALSGPAHLGAEPGA